MRFALIDDNSTVIKIAEVMLKKENFIKEHDEIELFTDISLFSGNNAMDFACTYDMIICDFNLGENSMNGLEFLKGIKNLGFTGHCILLTGDDSIKMKTKMLLQSNIHYIVKNNEKNKQGHIYQLGHLIEHYRNNAGK